MVPTPLGRGVASTERIADRITEEHATVLSKIVACADTVTASWSTETVTERAAVVDPLEACLDDGDILTALPAVLETGATALESTLLADPVPAPPYVIVTSRGPVLRGTLPDRRLVITVAVFAVEPGDPVRYRRRTDDTVEVELRDRGHPDG